MPDAQNLNLSGTVVAVTGANTGIGRAAALHLARLGATTILACRDPAKGHQAQADLRRLSGNDAVGLVRLDLGDLRSVQQCADELTADTDGIDILINNAGATFPTRALAPQGFERTFVVNYLGHYALTRLLLPHLRQPSRVINVSSTSHQITKGIRWDDLAFERRYASLTAYAHAKLAQILFTRELANRYGSTGLHAHALHPGFIGSDFYESGASPFTRALITPVVRAFAKTPEQGAETVIHLATTDDALHTNGGYWARSRPTAPAKAATDDQAARRLWDLSERLITDAGIVLPTP